MVSGSPGKRLAAAIHSTGEARILGRASAAVALEDIGRQRHPPHQLRTCSQPARHKAATPAQSEDVWSSSPPAAAHPGGGPRQTPQSLGGDAECGHPLLEHKAAVNKANLGVWLVMGEPAVARNLGVETTLSARSWASGVAGESIIQISATASSSSASGWVQQSLLHARHADTHTPAQRVCSDASLNA